MNKLVELTNEYGLKVAKIIIERDNLKAEGEELRKELDRIKKVNSKHWDALQDLITEKEHLRYERNEIKALNAEMLEALKALMKRQKDEEITAARLLIAKAEEEMR